ncbi:MAG TPA: ATP-binding protein [Bacteroidota bacterium]|nr:ATP-binding protein [Bacteroidota bacterium]
MSTTQELITMLHVAAIALLSASAKDAAHWLRFARTELGDANNDEDIAALALIVHVTERGAHTVFGSELQASLPRGASARPRWDLVLPRLARKGYISIDTSTEASSDGSSPDESSGGEMARTHAKRKPALRDMRITLLIREATTPAPTGFSGNREYLEHCFDYISRVYTDLQHDNPVRGWDEKIDHDSENEASTKASALLRRIQRRTRDTSFELPLEALRVREQLSDLEWHMLLYALRQHLNGEQIEVRHFAPFFGAGTFNSYELRCYFEGGGRLVQRNILLIEECSAILHCDVDIDPAIFAEIMSGAIPGIELDANATATVSTDAPFASSAEYLEQWLRFVEQRIDNAAVPGKRRKLSIGDKRDSVLTHPVFLSLLRRSVRSEASIPLERRIRDAGLSEAERFVLVSALLATLRDTFIDIPDVLQALGGDVLHTRTMRRIFDVDGTLQKERLIEVRDPIMGAPDFRMPVDTADRLLEQDSVEQATALRISTDFFERRTPRHSLDAVILPAAERERLGEALLALESGALAQLRSWGVHRHGGTRSDDSMLLLFSGAPGTGKTFAAEGMAGTLGRDMLVTDIGKLLSKWVGESEQSVIGLFAEYERLCRGAIAPPVLLLNECDQFFLRRSTGEHRAVDRMYHQMQNIFLEQLERFPGVLIATTNLTGVLDEAFSRRFDEKIEFPLPDARLRLALWEAQIPSAVPRAGDIDLGVLAERYVFSGGRIALAASNALRRAAVRGDELRMSDLLTCCEREERGAFEHATGAARVGFRTGAA